MAAVLATLIALIMSFASAWAYALVLYWADRHEKEPKRLLLGMFLWGSSFAILGAIFFSHSLDAGISRFVTSWPTRHWLSLTFTAPLVEESVKGLALILLFLFVREEVDSLFDGLIYGALVGLGFEAVENALYLRQAFLDHGLSSYLLVMALRLGLFGFTHAFYTALTGLGMAFAWLNARRIGAWLAVPVGWLLAVLAHSLHNATMTGGVPWCLFGALADWGGFWALVAIALYAPYRERRWLRDYLREEVAHGLISEAQYATACSVSRRGQAIRHARRRGDVGPTARFYALLTELAFLKARSQSGGLSPRRRERIERLREELARLAPLAESISPEQEGV